LVNFELKTFLTVFLYMNLSVPQFFYNTTMGQDRIAKQEITRKCRKFIDERNLHDKMIGVRLARKKEGMRRKIPIPSLCIQRYRK
jgi:hypothetical protein